MAVGPSRLGWEPEDGLSKELTELTCLKNGFPDFRGVALASQAHFSVRLRAPRPWAKSYVCARARACMRACGCVCKLYAGNHERKHSIFYSLTHSLNHAY